MAKQKKRQKQSPYWVTEAYTAHEKAGKFIGDMRRSYLEALKLIGKPGTEEINWDAILGHLAAMETEMLQSLPYERCQCEETPCPVCRGKFWISLRQVLEQDMSRGSSKAGRQRST